MLVSRERMKIVNSWKGVLGITSKLTLDPLIKPNPKLLRHKVSLYILENKYASK